MLEDVSELKYKQKVYNFIAVQNNVIAQTPLNCNVQNVFLKKYLQ